MGPKKGAAEADKKEVVDEAALKQQQLAQQQQQQLEEVQQQTSKVQQEGFGRFEYPNGMVYQGQWKIVNGSKVKHGEGTLLFAGTTSNEGGAEEYQGGWVNDKMEGYGVYRYTSGAIYSGEWKAGKHSGRGTYEFPDGTIYEGEFKDHRMHGEGYYIDKNGNRWEGEFVEGVYQSSKQQELKMEKLMNKKESEISENAKSFFPRFEEAFARSDKKTFKENLLPFFSVGEEVKQYVKDPYPKFEDRAPDKWNDGLKWIGGGFQINVLRHNGNAKIIDPANILTPQFQGPGQIVEFTREAEGRLARLALSNLQDNSWVIVFYHDSAEPEVKKK